MHWIELTTKDRGKAAVNLDNIERIEPDTKGDGSYLMGVFGCFHVTESYAEVKEKINDVQIKERMGCGNRF